MQIQPLFFYAQPGEIKSCTLKKIKQRLHTLQRQKKFFVFWMQRTLFVAPYMF
jgi:hypothetical protein